MNNQFEAVRLNIESRLKDYLEHAGMYYRIFSRAKDEESIKKKIGSKAASYRSKGKKMQDLIGVRIVFYFLDDVEIFHHKLKMLDGYDPQNESNSTKEIMELSDILDGLDDQFSHIKDELSKLLPFHDKVFMPERLNIVMRMNESERSLVQMGLASVTGYDTSLIDYTYEIQLRTVLSEGWHEVEHDLRYKTKEEAWWDYCQDESRMLNGLYATLETSERALSRMIEEITYKNYQNRSWDAMIRFHFRRRTVGRKLSQQIVDLLDSDDRLAKDLLRVQRENLVVWLWELTSMVPISTDFLFYLVNRKTIQRRDIIQMEPAPIKAVLDRMNIN